MIEDRRGGTLNIYLDLLFCFFIFAGFFVDVSVYNGSAAPAIMNMKSIECASREESRKDGECRQDDAVDETQNLMLKLKFLPYKVISKYA